MFNNSFNKNFQKLVKPTLLIGALVLSTSVFATKVVFDTSEGYIEVNLYDNATPKTVENFLSYVNDGTYDNSVIHRSVPGFIIQGGGFAFEGILDLTRLSTKASVINEPVYSNRRGTIAMAKLGNQPNSATNQWFFNLVDNQNILDAQNGGFTVFGEVVEGMDIVEKISNISLCHLSSPFDDIPMSDYNCSSGDVPGAENYVTIHSITISDTSKDSASDLTPVENTLIDVVDVVEESSGSSTFFGLFTLGLFLLARRK